MVRVFLSETGPWGQALFLVFLRIMHLAGLSAKINIYLELAHRWQARGLEMTQALAQLPIEVPAVAAVMSPGRLRSSLRDPRKMQKLQLEIAQIRLQYGTEIDAFFQRHPELSTNTP